MTQILQSLYIISPYLILLMLCAAGVTGVWLIFQLRKSNQQYDQFSIGDRLFLKRNAARMRKMQLH